VDFFCGADKPQVMGVGDHPRAGDIRVDGTRPLQSLEGQLIKPALFKNTWVGLPNLLVAPLDNAYKSGRAPCPARGPWVMQIESATFVRKAFCQHFANRRDVSSYLGVTPRALNRYSKPFHIRRAS
jgi:hypothetical protein